MDQILHYNNSYKENNVSIKQKKKTNKFFLKKVGVLWKNRHTLVMPSAVVNSESESTYVLMSAVPRGDGRLWDFFLVFNLQNI